jgi:phenylacetate-CoA ligase
VDREAFYLQLPWYAQHIAASLEGWRSQRDRYDAGFKSFLHDAQSRVFWTTEQMFAFRDERLRSFIRHCSTTVPYHRKIFFDLGISPEEINSIKDLQYLPVLTKKDVQDHYQQLVSDVVPQNERIIAHTSGTTGGGLRFAVTRSALQEQWAVWWRYRHWHGIQMGTWCGYFGGRSIVPISCAKPPFWRYNVPGKQILFSGYHMNQENMPNYVDCLRKWKPQWLHGYPSLLSLMAEYMMSSGCDLGYEIRWITTGAENLLPQQATLIEKVFGVTPRQHYGMAEAVANFSECDRGKLHVDEDFAAVEFLPNDDGLSYRVVGTNFTNPATALLRYDVEDNVTLDGENCSCGRPGRIVTRIDGRKEDYVILKNGTRIGRMDHIFKDMVNIREAQIYQKHPGEIILRIVRAGHYSNKDAESLLSETRKRVGENALIHLEYVDRLERSKTGKLRFVVSELDEGKIGAS